VCRKPSSLTLPQIETILVHNDAIFKLDDVRRDWRALG